MYIMCASDFDLCSFFWGFLLLLVVALFLGFHLLVFLIGTLLISGDEAAAASLFYARSCSSGQWVVCRSRPCLQLRTGTVVTFLETN